MNNISFAPKIGAACAGALLAVSLAGVPFASADTLIKSYSADEVIVQNLEQDGTTWQLQSWQHTESDTTQAKVFDHVEKTTLSADAYNGKPASYFATSWTIDEDGFNGGIPLAEAKADIATSHQEVYDLFQDVTFANWTNAQIEGLSDTLTTDGRTYALETVNKSPVGTVADDRFSGVAVYVCHVDDTVADSWELTATYHGELATGGPESGIEAVYESQAPETTTVSPVTAPAETPEATPTSAMSSAFSFVFALLIPLAMILLVFALGVFLVRLFTEKKKATMNPIIISDVSSVKSEEQPIEDVTPIESDELCEDNRDPDEGVEAEQPRPVGSKWHK